MGTRGSSGVVVARPRATTVVSGQVLVSADGVTPTVEEAIGIRDGVVVDVGTRREVLERAAPDAPHIEAGERAVLPGLHDFHLHLVGMARARLELHLGDARGPDELVALVAPAADRMQAGGWLRGRGWSEAAMSGAAAERLAAATDGVAALLYSHDSHSAWASPTALRAAGLDATTPDPPGGRLERGRDGTLTGVLRERATDLVERVAARTDPAGMAAALRDVAADLAARGVTTVVDAGDTSPDNGTGPYAALGDRASVLIAAAGDLDRHLRIRVGFPAAAAGAAAELGIRSGAPVGDAATVQFGWAKAYLDGALGSRTAALFEPYECAPGVSAAPDAGIVRLTDGELDEILRVARPAGIAVAMHAIGDRAVAGALDALRRNPRPADGRPADRIEHLQLMRLSDVPRLAALDVTASVQPVHCPSDREAIEACWSSRLERAYPWRALLDAGARIAAGSDAPIEHHDPWRGIFAAVHRRTPGDPTADWQAGQAMSPIEALRAYTAGAGRAWGRDDLGHLERGARADLAVLNVNLATLMAADERLAEVRSELTLVDGIEVHRS